MYLAVERRNGYCEGLSDKKSQKFRDPGSRDCQIFKIWQICQILKIWLVDDKSTPTDDGADREIPWDKGFLDVVDLTTCRR